MRLQSLHLFNFRQYKDFKLEFPERNGVTVIRANNSIGKTTLMQSIKWVLFGDSAIELDNKKELLNYSVLKEEKENYSSQSSFFVEISILHKGVSYSLKREHIVNITSNTLLEERLTLSFLENGETKIYKNTSEENKSVIYRMIESWISEKMLNYFFLDGERIEKLSNGDSESQAELSEAITSVSKIPVLKNAIDTVEVVFNDVKRQEAKATRNSEIVALQNEISDLSSEKRYLENEKKTCENDNKEISDQINNIEKELLNTKEVSNYQFERNRTQRELNTISEEMNSILKRIQTLNNDYRRKTLIYMLYQKYNLNDFKGKEAEKTIPNMEINAIDQIIKNVICICGTHLKSEHINTLEHQKKYQPPVSNQGLIATYEMGVKTEILGIDNDAKELLDEIDKYFNYHDRKCELIDYLEDINKKISGFNEEKIQNLNNYRHELSVKKDARTNKITELNMRLKELEKTLTRKEKVYKKKLENYEQNKIIENKRYLIKEVSNMLNNKNETEKEIQRKSIEKYANNHFSDIISKQKRVIIDEKYKHTVRDLDGNKTSLSSGESIALSVSIILAIIDTHKDNLEKNNKENILMEREFFLFLDGAFAVLDQNFSKAIAEKITERLNQVIILTNDNQYTESVKDAIKPKLKHEYILSIEAKQEKENILTSHLLEVK